MMPDRRFRPLTLKIAIALSAVAGAILLDSSKAVPAQGRQRAPPWCAYMGGFGGNFDCSYYTFEQCMATARGLGGTCSPNPRAVSEPVPTRPRVRN
jgi:hypothetical protein